MTASLATYSMGAYVAVTGQRAEKIGMVLGSRVDRKATAQTGELQLTYRVLICEDPDNHFLLVGVAEEKLRAIDNPARWPAWSKARKRRSLDGGEQENTA